MPESIVLLIFSSHQRNRKLLTQVLEQADYRVNAVGSYDELETAISESVAELALIDLAKCDRHIWNYCEQLQANHIPFLTFTPQRSLALERGSLAHGAKSVLIKPLVIKNLLLLINSIVGKST